MASMRKLRRRLLRWQRYDSRNVRSLDDARRVTVPPGLTRAARAVDAEDERRFWAETPEVWLGGPAGEAALIGDVFGVCDVCGLPDLHRGQGDGIGSCDCPRCDCGAARSSSFCTCDPACDYCGEFGCEGDCDEAYADEPDDDAGYGDSWPPGVVTEHALTDRGLL